jgi:hypothetical protein
MGPIKHYPDHSSLYCRPCRAVVFKEGLQRHLQAYHRQLPLPWRKQLVEHCQSLNLITRKEDLKLQPNHSPALHFLPTTEGYSCMQDNCWYLSSSKS